MQVHGSCVARDGFGVLIRGAAGSGKSGLALRLRQHGFSLVADDIVEIVDGVARAPDAIAGLLEVRGLGVVRMAFQAAKLALVTEVSASPERLPHPQRDAVLGLPLIRVRAHAADAADIVALALDCVLGQQTCVIGAFAA